MPRCKDLLQMPLRRWWAGLRFRGRWEPGRSCHTCKRLCLRSMRTCVLTPPSTLVPSVALWRLRHCPPGSSNSLWLTCRSCTSQASPWMPGALSGQAPAAQTRLEAVQSVGMESKAGRSAEAGQVHTRAGLCSSLQVPPAQQRHPPPHSAPLFHA